MTMTTRGSAAHLLASAAFDLRAANCPPSPTGPEVKDDERAQLRARADRLHAIPAEPEESIGLTYARRIADVMVEWLSETIIPAEISWSRLVRLSDDYEHQRLTGG